MLGAVPLDPVLQWREQLITGSDVWASHVANEATVNAFDSIAKQMVDESAWNDRERRQDRFSGDQRRLQGGLAAAFPVSVDIGHLYMEDLGAGVNAVQRTFAAAAPWIRAARAPQAIGCEKKSVRLSTCFLIDDYFGRFSTPAAVIPMVLAAAERENLEIDYLARESACATAGDASPASLTVGSLVTVAGPRDDRRPAAAPRPAG